MILVICVSLVQTSQQFKFLQTCKKKYLNELFLLVRGGRQFGFQMFGLLELHTAQLKSEKATSTIKQHLNAIF